MDQGVHYPRLVPQIEGDQLAYGEHDINMQNEGVERTLPERDQEPASQPASLEKAAMQLARARVYPEQMPMILLS